MNAATSRSHKATQDFVLDTGNRFAAGTASQFPMNHRMLEHAPEIPDALKAAVSSISRAGNKALHRVGGDSPTLDFFGHSRVHPLAEAYFTQAPIRYGAYLAKIAVVPVAPAQRALEGTAVDRTDADALRTATVDYPEMACLRREANGVALGEPTTLDDVPA